MKTSKRPNQTWSRFTIRHGLTMLGLSAILLATPSAFAASGTWTNLAAGNWSGTANWLNGIIADGVGDTATISSDITAGRIVTLDGNRTLGTLSLGDSGASYFAFTIASSSLVPNQIIFDQTGTADASLTYPVTANTAASTISAGITLNDNLVISALTPFLPVHTISGPITDGASSYSITISSNTTGILQFSGTNTHHGGTFINNARLQVTRAAAVGYGPIWVKTNAQLYITAGGTFTNDFYLAGIGPVAAANQLGAVRIDSATLSGNIVLTDNARIGVFQNVIGRLTGTLSGNYELEVANGNTATSASTIQLSVTSNSVAATRISSLGSFPINAVAMNATAFSSGPLVMNGGTLKLNGFDFAFSNLTSTAANGQVQVGAGLPSTFTVGMDNSSTVYGGTFADGGGALAVTKVGSGTLTLTGDHNYSGNTTVSNGALKLLPVSGGLSGFGSVIVNPNGTFGGCGTVNGTVTVENGGTLLVEGNAGVALTTTSPLTLGSGPTDATSTSINVALGNKVLGSTVTVNGTNTINVIGGSLNVGVYDLITYSGSTPFAGFKLGPLSPGLVANLQDSGSAVQLNVTSSTVEPKIWVGALASNWNPAAGNEWKGAGSGLPQPYINGDAVIFNDAATNFTVNLSVNASPASILFTNDSKNYTINGVGTLGGFGGLTKEGTGALVLNVTNNSAGGVSVGAGTLTVTAPNSSSGNTLIAGGGTLIVGNGGTRGNLGGGGITNNGVLTYQRSDTVSVSMVIEGTGNVEQRGSGTLVLAANNSYAGSTFITNGTVQVGFNSTVGTLGSADITNHGALVFFRSDTSDIPIFNNISGSGSMDMRGVNIVGGNHSPYVFYGDNSGFSGVLTVTQSRLQVGTQANLGASPNVLSTNGGTVLLSVGTFSNRFVLLGTGWLQGAVNVGALRLDGGATVTGPIQLAGGTRIVGFAGGIGTLAGPLTGSAALEINASGAQFNGVITNAGNASGFTGPVTISGGGLIVNSPLGASGVTVVANALLSGSGSISGSVVNRGILAPGNGVGTLATGSETWSSNSICSIELTNAAVATGFDKLNITGTLDIQASTDSPVVIRLASLAADGSVGPMDGFSNASTYSWTIATASGGILNFDPAKFVVDAAAIINDTTGNTFSVAAVGNSLVVNYGSTVSTTPIAISSVVTNGNLNISWPADHTGWRLEVQTNALSVGVSTNWSTWPNSATTNSVFVPVSQSNPTVFFRLVYP